jgi:hypothetical protein
MNGFKELRENIDSLIDEIKSWIKKKSILESMQCIEKANNKKGRLYLLIGTPREDDKLKIRTVPFYALKIAYIKRRLKCYFMLTRRSATWTGSVWRLAVGN